ncbi:2395_t:CDS:2 [Paraglomus occultum]|uniref:2395_t:CDS:1 n=1 Tax=Paraglomus occultum TaxID=144539 RepID=A0A9N9DGS4_9GLOM|nr:2395_t:CDS:2 [Paraglomus occultum]
MEKTARKKTSLKDELELYNFLSTVYYWDVLVYIFICLWDKEKYLYDNANSKLAFQLKSDMEKLYQCRGTRVDDVNRAEGLLDKFMRSRAKKEDCDRFIRKAHANVAYKKITLPIRFEDTIRHMSSDHRSSLMQTCMQLLRNRASTAKRAYTNKDGKNVNLEDANADGDIEADNLDSLRYQASLSNLTNFRWTDDDDNNAVHLTEDINSFRLFLEDFTRVKGRDITFHEQEARKLLEEYKCGEGGSLKSTLSSVLARRVVELVQDSIDKYFRQTKFDTKIEVDVAATDIGTSSSHNAADTLDNFNSENLEAEIVGTTKKLTKLLNRFVDIREGNDVLSQVVSAQIRQRVHAILGFRGFSNENHGVIKSITEEVIELMNKYRTITDKTKLEQSEKDAVRIVRDFICIFIFRLQAQEPVPTVEFIEAGEKFDRGVMEGSADEKKCRNARVELCWFPVISTDIGDSKKRKTYSKARVLLKYSEEEDDEEYSNSEESESAESESEESTDTDAAVAFDKNEAKTGAEIVSDVSDVDNTVGVDVVNVDSDSSKNESDSEAQNAMINNSIGNTNE